MGIKFIKVAIIYLLIGMFMGALMATTKDFSVISVHTHLLLLGWEVFALAGVIYHLYPELGENSLAKVQFWLHNIGLPIMLTGKLLIVFQRTEFEPVAVVGTLLVVASIILFAINFFKNNRVKL